MGSKEMGWWGDGECEGCVDAPSSASRKVPGGLAVGWSSITTNQCRDVPWQACTTINNQQSTFVFFLQFF
ncbi:hypothetical protein NIES592_17630 [Fischerella major NIES-592]|uniref:Uncharacterized protein n=1 Tax=Fischerella major NIES-592 TaxID=210994 RepID=A0A1U7GWM2_9CYAN|nr:hypothetical protein NIES592_17630 [Fischerella major NIES-592]